MKSNRERPPKVSITTTTSDEPEEDRLSSLHDSVLCHILSFLPTKYAAIASVLSTRWRSLFLGVPLIDLDESLLLKKPREEQGRRTSVNHDFINFVNRRLMLCQTASVTEFQLRCKSFPEAPMFDSWITTLLFRNVKRLEIKSLVWYSPPLCLPNGIFRLESLVVLKLCGRNFVLRIPENVCFRNLKVLHLEYLDMQFESNNIRIAEEGYPLLEDLRFFQIRIRKNEENIDTLGISMGSLKKLSIVGVGAEISKIDIDTPHLQHLECQAFLIPISKMAINFRRCETLSSAYISLSPVPIAATEEVQCLIELLNNLNNVRELRLSEGSSEVMSACVSSLLQFPNLTYLELTRDRESVWSLLQLAPNLKTLVCSWVHFGNILPHGNEHLCFARTLTEIRITNFVESIHATMIFFLEHAAALEKMIIHPYSLEEWRTFKQLLKQMLRSPKGEFEFIDLRSPCQIIEMPSVVRCNRLLYSIRR